MTTEIKVISENCPANHTCPAVRVCLTSALIQNGFNAPIIDLSKCTKCGKCTKVCPMGALIIEKT